MGYFQDGVQDGCRELHVLLLISTALFNRERCSWCLIVEFNTTNVSTGIASGNASPKPGKSRRVSLRESISFENCRYPSTIQPTKVILVSSHRFYCSVSVNDVIKIIYKQIR